MRWIWDFVVGDDPIVAAGVVVAVGVTAALGTWWPMPVAVAGLLYASLKRATR